MASFFTTTTIKRPSQDFVPHLESGSDLGYGLKIYKGYVDVAVSGGAVSYYVTNAETGTTLTLHPRSGIIGGGIKAKDGALVSAGAVTLSIMNPNTTTAIISTGHSIANVNSGIGITYGDLTTSVALTQITSGTSIYSYPILTMEAAVTTGDRVYITLLSMETDP